MTTRIFEFNSQRSEIVDEVVRRVRGSQKDPIFTLSEAAYLEMRRLEKQGGPKYASFRQMAQKLGRMNEAEALENVEKLATEYAWDVAGNFDPRVYKFASKAMAPLLGAMLSPRSTLKNLPHSLDLTGLDSRILVEGPREQIKRLAEKGTLVFTPTHLSNLDSVVFGFALERAGLPPATYGAGKNLFTNPVLSYFMHNLGAYRVDRRLKHVLYKDVLKQYSQVLIERGYHSLFFPGGTRSRSGGVERKLKLGLAGTAIDAYGRSVEEGRPQPVYFVPATINYLLTLEAESLIDDFLEEEGKARYIIEDDESTRVGRVAAFMQKLLGLDAACVIRFAPPLDCFGNDVDDDGNSLDPNGRVVPTESYLMNKSGRACRDHLRDAEYTRELGDRICERFKENTVVLATHVVAAAAFGCLTRSVPREQTRDVFAILRHRDDVRVPRSELAQHVDNLLGQLREQERLGKLVLGPGLAHKAGDEVLRDALRAFAGYHTNEVLSPRGSDLLLYDTRLLFYYQNRLAAHGLAYDVIAPKPRAAA